MEEWQGHIAQEYMEMENIIEVIWGKYNLS